MSAAQLSITQHRPNWPGWLVLAVILSAAGIYVYQSLFLGPMLVAREASRTDLVQSIVSSGRIVTPRRVSIGSVVTDRVIAVPVAEGQRVTRGQLLIELDSSDETAALAQARAALDQTEARLRQIRELNLPASEQALQQALANARQARVQHDRTQILRDKGFVGESQLDDARRNLDVTESQVRAARLPVESSRSGGSDHALAIAAAAQARANVSAAEARLAQSFIRAPLDGVLIGRGVEPGNVIAPGKELLVLAPLGETRIVAQLDERHLSRLATGQRALASADAFPTSRFAAELSYINPGIDALRGTVEVKLRVGDPPGYLRQDMTVSVDIETARRPNTIVIAADAVRDASGASPWVLIVRDNRAVRQAVRLGLRGDGNVEILEGVAAGDLLVPASLATVAPGDRVRAAAPDRSAAK